MQVRPLSCSGWSYWGYICGLASDPPNNVKDA